jgi:predicted solute-binding protein
MNKEGKRRNKEAEKILQEAMKKRYSFEETVIQPLMKKTGMPRDDVIIMLHEFGW